MKTNLFCGFSLFVVSLLCCLFLFPGLSLFYGLSLFCVLFQAVDIRQIYDKFPEKKGGLKELYDKGPQASFFLVKFWVSFKQLLCKYLSIKWPDLEAYWVKNKPSCIKSWILHRFFKYLLSEKGSWIWVCYIRFY